MTPEGVPLWEVARDEVERGGNVPALDRLYRALLHYKALAERYRQAIPEDERWLWDNPEALASVMQGLREAAEGKTTPYRLAAEQENESS